MKTNPYFQAAASDSNYKPLEKMTAEQQAKARRMVEEYNQRTMEMGPRPRGSEAEPPYLVEAEHCVFNFRTKHFVWSMAREAFPMQNYKFSHSELYILKCEGRLYA